MDSGSVDATKLASLSLENRDKESNFSEETVGENESVIEFSKVDSSCGTKKKKKRKKKDKSASKGITDNPLPTQKYVDEYFPWTSLYRPGFGRSAVASREIKAGEVVVAEHCVTFIPRSREPSVVCHRCCADLTPPVPSFECPDCRYATFCSTCKKEGLNGHKVLCQTSSAIRRIAKLVDCDEDLLRIIMSLVVKGRSHRKAAKTQDAVEALGSDFSKDGTVQDGVIYSSYEDVISLKTHSEKASPAWKLSVRKGCEMLREEVIKNLAMDNLDESIEDLENIAALVNTNCHGMGAHGTGYHNSDVAVGIFPFVSMLNHSCRPNCCFSSLGRIMYVRATEDITEGTELTVSYINLYEPRSTRRSQLAASKHFLCTCQRCSEPFAYSVDRFLEGCLCSVRGCGGVLLKSSSLHEGADNKNVIPSLSSWTCDQCSLVLDPVVNSNRTSKQTVGHHPWQLTLAAEEKLSAAMSVYNERSFKEARTLLEKYISEFTGKLHPFNVLLFDALTPLMNCCRAMGDASEGSRVCRLIINALEKVLPGVSLELANFYFCLGEMYSQKSESARDRVMIKHYKKQSQEAFQQVRRIRGICLGSASLPTS